MSTGIVKKARGRPPKSSVPYIKQEVESLESNRQTGSMSLRPNKRVRLTKYDDDYDYSNLDDDDEYIVPDNKSDENSEDFIGEEYDAKYDDSQYDENMEDLANRDAFQNHRRRSRKMIMYNPKMAVKMRKEQLNKDNNDGGNVLIQRPNKIFSVKFSKFNLCSFAELFLQNVKLQSYFLLFQLKVTDLTSSIPLIFKIKSRFA